MPEKELLGFPKLKRPPLERRENQRLLFYPPELEQL
jgi:hypothetical protein